MRFLTFLIVVAFAIVAGCAADGADSKTPADRWLRLVQTIRLDGVEGRIDHFALDEKGHRLFMAALGNDSVEVIDAVAGKVVGQIKGLQAPQGVAFAPEANRIAVANDKDGSCRIFDGTSLKQVGNVDLKDDADNVRYDAGGGVFWVGYGDGGLAAIDVAKGVQIKDIKVEGHPESFQLEQKGKRIFVNVPRPGHVAVVDREKGTVIDKWPLKVAQSNFPMALDEENHRLFVGCRKPAKMVVIDTISGKEIAGVDCVGDTDDLFYDLTNKRIYVVGGEGAVDVIEQSDADHYRRVACVKTAPGARTAWIAAAEGRLFVAVPHRGGQNAELRVFEARKD